MFMADVKLQFLLINIVFILDIVHACFVNCCLSTLLRSIALLHTRMGQTVADDGQWRSNESHGSGLEPFLL